MTAKFNYYWWGLLKSCNLCVQKNFNTNEEWVAWLLRFEKWAGCKFLFNTHNIRILWAGRMRHLIFCILEQGSRSCAKGLHRKVWTWTKILGPNIRQFVATLRFDSILQGKSFSGQKQCFFNRQGVHYYMVYIPYCTELNLQLRTTTTHFSQN